MTKEHFIVGLTYQLGNLGLSYSGSISMKFKNSWEDEVNNEQNMEHKCEWVIGFLKDLGTISKTKSLRSLQSVGSFIISMGNNCFEVSSIVATYAAKALKELDIDYLVANELNGQPKFKKLYMEIKDGLESYHD